MTDDHPAKDTELREARTFARALALVPDQVPSQVVLGRQEGEVPGDDARDIADGVGVDVDESISHIGENALDFGDWANAERARPDMPDETADGLDDLSEEVRRQAEDRPPGREDQDR